MVSDLEGEPTIQVSRIMLKTRLTEALLFLQAFAIIGLLYWLVSERQANGFMKAWDSQNFPAVSSLLNWPVLFVLSATVLGMSIFWTFNVELARRNDAVVGPFQKPTLVENQKVSTQTAMIRQFDVQFLRPFYELVDFRTLVLLLALLAQSIALLILTASTFTISTLPADSFFYVSHLPFTHWWGFSAAFALFFAGRLVTRRLRTILEIASLLLLATYTLGLPSFVYNTPRILDSYQHAGNTLGLINNSGWPDSPIWYARQFPGAYTFFAQLITIPGIDAFSLMKYYPVALSSIMVIFVYAIARTYSRQYAGVATGVFLGAVWFQLHLSPQSLELVLYLGLVLVLIKMMENPHSSKPWTLLALATVPAFVVSHPETTLVVIPGMALFLTFILVRSRELIRDLLPTIGLALIALTGMFVLWWSIFAYEARNLIAGFVEKAAASLPSLLAFPPPTTSIPSHPAYSYQVTITLEQGVSVAVWGLGAISILLSRLKLLRREAFLASLFTVAVLTIPLTVFVRTDMLKRSYLFSLLPEVILLAWLLERKVVFGIRGRSLHKPFRAVLLIAMIVFLTIVPITRNGNDPFEQIPQASLFASSVAGRLQQHSVLFLEFGEYGYWYESTLEGGRESPKDQQPDMSTLHGGFIQYNSVLSSFNLTFTQSDNSSNYILLSDYYLNLYLLRYGPRSSFYLNQRNSFENQTSMNFNLVYSTGTDRIYAHQNLP